MKIQTSSGFQYSYNPIDNSIVDVDSMGPSDLNIRFKPLGEISEFPNISSFTIGVTERCNLRCSYCCYSGSYAEHRNHSTSNLSDDQIPSVIDFILKYINSNEISIDFYGGESLLELDWIKKFIQKAKGIETVVWNFEVSTNGILLVSDIVDWLVANQFNVFVSVDGVGHFHDVCRKDINGQPSYATIEKNLSYIKEHYPDFWTNNVHIMMTVRDISNLPEIAVSWDSSTLFEDKAPYRMSEVSTVYNDTTLKLDEDSELDKYLQLVDWYKGHPDNSLMGTFFNIWLAEWINRPIGEIEPNIEYPTCVPDNRKLYIDAKGSIGICERISDAIRIGSLTQGIDYTKVNSIAKSTASFIESHCSRCEIARVCDLCPDILKISDDIQETYCHNQKVIQQIKFRCFCELAEDELI